MPYDVKSWRSKRRSLTTLNHAVAAILLVLTGLLGITQPASAADGEFVNISTRSFVGTGDEVMIGGFIIEGGSRQVLIQALGPELADAGIANALADPVLRVIDTSDPENVRELMFNDNWEDSQGQLVSDLWAGSPNLTAGSLSSAAVLTLEPGNYTAIVEGKNGTAGVAIVEVYEIDLDGADGKFINLSTRAVVRTGDEVMIGGFIIEGGSRQVAIHALGPELADRGVSNVLADPMLTVIQTSEGEPPRTPINPPIELMFNDDWEDTQGELIPDLLGPGLSFTAGSKSSAAVLTLEPGNYTAIVEGKDGTTGITLVEVLRIDLPDAGSPDREALTALYNATGGANWTRSDNWGSNAPLDQWYGVTVDDNGRVVELRLSENQLSGPIPSEFGSLSSLTRLYLFNNSDLSGSLPGSFTDLGALVDLYLFGTGLCAPTDDAFQSWLQGVPNKSGVVNCGSIAGDRSALVALYNATDGANWTTITNWNSNAPLDQWFGVTVDENGRVIELNLHENRLSGSIPVELGDLTRLERLWFYDNQLSGSIPTELGNLPNLETLNLRTNQLSGGIPDTLGNLVNLQYLGLHDNQLSGPVPTTLGQLANLEGLYLHENQLSGLIPVELGQLANLEELALYDNQLSGPIPSELGNLANLQYLGLQVNQLNGSIPVELAQLANLQRLVLHDNQLTGPIPMELGQLASLTGLWLDNNQLIGAIPEELGNLANLETLYLGANNQFSGCIPTGLWDVAESDLSTLGLPFCGSIATDRAALVALYNATDGPNWTNSDNWLSDAPLGDWHGVRVDANGRVIDLSLDDNQLSGSIPPELGNLSSLLELDLSDNADLAGPLPGSLTYLMKLAELDLNETGLCAPVDEAFQAWLAGIYIWGAVNNCTSAQSDRAALVALYNATDGPNWTNSDNWLSDAPLGDWHGVTTDPAGRVNSLALRENLLSGSIPPELGDLTSLTGLDLGLNALSGSIPPELGNLTNLQTLDLAYGDNALSGVIPADLGNLTNLTRLRLGGNELSGQIPAWLSSLANLEDLGLSRNQLTGAIPTELGNLSNLQYLSLPHNQLSGSIPAELGNLLILKELYLGGNELTGPITAELGSLASLERLELFGNQLSGSIPPELGSLANLERLELWGNQLSGSIPPELGSLSNLTVLYLYSNQLSGVIPPELGNLSNLVGLVLYSNQLSGVIPPELGSLSNLTVLFLINNRLSGVIPVELGNLTNLRTLGLTVNQLSGSIPVELGNLANLRTLELNVNQLSGSIPPELGSLSNLTRLDLSSNQLSGVIPVELGNLANLERLELWVNQLSGSIPAELGSLANLERLELWGNRLSGSIPPELGSLSNLTILYLSSNQLSGVIPPELGNLANLEYLSLWRNQLSGSIPDSFLELSNLETFQFTDNNGLCAPNTNAFTSWLLGITEWSGPRCD